jgi:hypothetical protein
MLCGENEIPGYPGDRHCIPQAGSPDSNPTDRNGTEKLGIVAPRFEDYSWTIMVPVGK